MYSNSLTSFSTSNTIFTMPSNTNTNTNVNMKQVFNTGADKFLYMSQVAKPKAPVLSFDEAACKAQEQTLANALTQSTMAEAPEHVVRQYERDYAYRNLSWTAKMQAARTPAQFWKKSVYGCEPEKTPGQAAEQAEANRLSYRSKVYEKRFAEWDQKHDEIRMLEKLERDNALVSDERDPIVAAALARAKEEMKPLNGHLPTIRVRKSRARKVEKPKSGFEARLKTKMKALKKR